jgi:hypothetical protein
MNLKKITISVCATLVLVFVSCRKAGKGGEASISGKVLHHETLMANARVFIKYNASEFPGADTTKYDDFVKADNLGNYTFKALKRGRYFLYGVGKEGVANGNPYDVVGGARVDINKKTENIQFNLSITEGD